MGYVEVLGDKITMHIMVNLDRDYLIVLRLFYLVGIVNCGRFNSSCNMWLFLCVGFVMCGCVCVCKGFVMCVCFDNCMDVLVICVLVLT